MSGAQSAVVLDHTALLALGAGSHLVSRMVASAHRESGHYVYAPAMCLAGAVAERPRLADHIGALLAVEVVDLGYASAVAVGGLIAAGVDWRTAHAIDTARPTLEWPTGRPVVTTLPDPYDGWDVHHHPELTLPRADTGRAAQRSSFQSTPSSPRADATRSQRSTINEPTRTALAASTRAIRATGDPVRADMGIPRRGHRLHALPRGVLRRLQHRLR